MSELLTGVGEYDSAAIREIQGHQELLDQYGIDVLARPFDLDTLLDKVATALDRGRRPHQPRK